MDLNKRLSKLEERSSPAVVLCAEYFAAYPFTEEDKARARAKVRDLEMKMMSDAQLIRILTDGQATDITDEELERILKGEPYATK